MDSTRQHLGLRGSTPSSLMTHVDTGMADQAFRRPGNLEKPRIGYLSFSW